MNKPSYYAIIPANVRYDKDLCPNAKLLYGEITCLAEKEGFCWASNAYFAKLYQVSPNTASIWIQQLNAKGYIIGVIDEEAGNQRKLYLPETITKNRETYHENNGDPITKNREHINTRVNTIKEKNMYSVEFLGFWEIYPRQTNKKGAYKKWIATKKREKDMDTVMQGVEVYAAECKRKKTSIDFILNPATFLGPDEHWREYAEKYKPPKEYVEPVDYKDYLEAREKKQ